jgi:hypothetical protein
MEFYVDRNNMYGRVMTYGPFDTRRELVEFVCDNGFQYSSHDDAPPDNTYIYTSHGDDITEEVIDEIMNYIL